MQGHACRLQQVDISHNVKSDFMPPCCNSLSGNCGNSFGLNVSFFCQIFRSKSKKVKNGLKLNAMFTLFIQFHGATGLSAVCVCGIS